MKKYKGTYKSTHTKREKIKVSWIFLLKHKQIFFKKLYVDEPFFVIILRTLNHEQSILKFPKKFQIPDM